MTPTERKQIREFAAEAEQAIRAIASKPGRKERTALASIAKILEVAGSEVKK